MNDVKAEIAQGRKVQVFATFTGEHDVTDRLKWVFASAGLRVAVLKSSVPTEKREAWYAARLAEGVQVVISHPKLVKTGLDLLDFPTIYFYETGYSLHTLRQASRRSRRIGQRRPVRIKFLMYSGTVQEKQVSLMGRKLLVALMLEGKMSGEGLDGFEEDDDMMSSLVRELLSEGRVGESADAIWKNLERERGAHISAPAEPLADVMDTPEGGALLSFDTDANIEQTFTNETELFAPAPAELVTVKSPATQPTQQPTLAKILDFAVAGAAARKSRKATQAAIAEEVGQMLLFA